MLEGAPPGDGASAAAQRPLIAFGSEEQLMLGSYHDVAHPLRPLETSVAVLWQNLHAGHRGRYALASTSPQTRMVANEASVST